MAHQPRSAEKVRQMWCKCGARRPWTRHEGPISAPRTAVTWTFFGADDGIRTRDPHLGKVLESVHPVLLRPSTWAPSVSSSGKCCQIRPVVARVTTGRQARTPRRPTTLSSHSRSPPSVGRRCGLPARRSRRALVSIAASSRPARACAVSECEHVHRSYPRSRPCGRWAFDTAVELADEALTTWRRFSHPRAVRRRSALTCAAHRSQ